jgi:hypothetical protein
LKIWENFEQFNKIISDKDKNIESQTNKS